MVRLHFYPFSSPKNNLPNAYFNVSASGYLLLSNFRVQNTSNSPVIKEFILFISVEKFKIYFTPHESFFAFVNAIETFLAPKDFIPDYAIHVTPAGSNSNNYSGLLSRILNPIYRINMGGEFLDSFNDTLWRIWIPDDDFLYNKSAAKNSPYYSSRPNYRQGGATEYDAPDFVYSTAKELDIVDTEGQTNFLNITWQFNVTKNATYFVRAHFCDIAHRALSLAKFNFYIYSKYSWLVDSYNEVHDLGVPFYKDFVVDLDTSGLLNISIGNGPESRNQTAFLNGLEIMELMKDGSSVGPGQSKSKKKKSLFVIIGYVVGGVSFALVLLVVISVGLKRRKEKAVENLDWPLVNLYGGSSSSELTERTANNLPPLPNLNLGLKVPFVEILNAANNFDAKLMIGGGGFGKVYKGTLRGGMKVAVKRSEAGHGQGFPEFQTEIVVLSNIRHRHLVSLIGYCDERSEMILVYEFMENGTLREHLYEYSDNKSSSLSKLSWNQRLDICIGAAKGLHYLHTGSGGGIIHRDVKSTNILLDKHFVAKVADFGLSRSGPLDQTHVSTEVKGSFGYLDPEYFRCLQLTQKSDVYSFGVVLLEVLCARPAINNLLPRDQVNLADWGISWQKKGQLEKIADPFLVGNINPNSLRKFGETVEKCLREYGVDRPSMIDVLWDLQYALQLQQLRVIREPHEDSNTDVSWAISLPAVQRLPSTSTSIEEDEMPLGLDNDSDSGYVNVTEVFSQLRIDDAR